MVGVGIAHPQNNGQFAPLPERHERLESRIEAELLAELQDALTRYSKLWPQVVILLVPIGYNRV